MLHDFVLQFHHEIPLQFGDFIVAKSTSNHHHMIFTIAQHDFTCSQIQAVSGQPVSRGQIQAIPVFPGEGDFAASYDLRHPLVAGGACPQLDVRRMPEDPGGSDGGGRGAVGFAQFIQHLVQLRVCLPVSHKAALKEAILEG